MGFVYPFPVYLYWLIKFVWFELEPAQTLKLKQQRLARSELHYNEQT